jgi:hypothetical protein
MMLLLQVMHDEPRPTRKLNGTGRSGHPTAIFGGIVAGTSRQR